MLTIFRERPRLQINGRRATVSPELIGFDIIVVGKTSEEDRA